MNIPGGSGLADHVVETVISYLDGLALRHKRQKELIHVTPQPPFCSACQFLANETKFCPSCGYFQCNLCKEREFINCKACPEAMCNECMEKCSVCNAIFCPRDVEYCDTCGFKVCWDCENMDKCPMHPCPSCGETMCPSCFEHQKTVCGDAEIICDWCCTRSE